MKKVDFKNYKRSWFFVIIIGLGIIYSALSFIICGQFVSRTPQKQSFVIISSELINKGLKDFERNDTTITSKSNDPWIEVKLDGKEPVGSVAISISKLSTSHSNGQLFYAIEGQEYTTDQCVSFKVVNGENIVSLPEGPLVTALRFDLTDMIGVSMDVSQIKMMEPISHINRFWTIFLFLSAFYIILCLLIINTPKDKREYYLIELGLLFSKFFKSHLTIVCLISVTIFILGIFSHYLGSNELSGFLICSSLLFLYYGIICWVLKVCGFFVYLRRLGKRDVILSALILLGVTIFVFFEIDKDQFVYFWDYGGYWAVTIEHSRMFFTSPLQTLGNLYQSINTAEYNNIIPSLLALPMKIIGEEFISYVMLVLLLFVCPMALILSVSFCKIIDKVGLKLIPFPIILILTLLIPALYIPLFYGYLDAASLLVAATLLLIPVQINWYVFDYKKCVALALMLLLMILQRRYFSFFAVGFIVSISLFILSEALRENDNRKQLVKYFFVNMAFIGTLCLGILLIFFKGFLYHSLFNDFSIAYSAYSNGGFWSKNKEVIEYFGLFSCSIMVLGFVVGTLKRETRSVSIMCFSSILITEILFFRIQSMNIHHKYLLFSQFIILTLIGFNWIYNLLIQKQLKRILLFLMALLVATNFSDTFGLIPATDMGKLLFSKESYRPKIRKDIVQLEKLVEDLKLMVKKDSSQIYVLSSSVYLNDDIIRKIYLPDMLNSIPELLFSAQVDLRDGFPVEFLNADIIVVADPIQYHLKPKDQRVVGILAKELLTNGIIGDNFKFAKNYVLDSNIKVSIYKKETQFTADEILHLSNEFNRVYPEFPELFKKRIESYLP